MSTDSNVIKVQGNWFTVSKLSLFQTANQTSPSHLYIFFVNKTNRALNMYKNGWGGVGIQLFANILHCTKT